MNEPVRANESLRVSGDYRAHAQALLFCDPSSTATLSVQELVREINAGIRTTLVSLVSKRYHIPELRLAQFLHISGSTMKRRRRAGHLTTTESDRFVRLAGLYAMAEDIFDSADLAARWMSEANRSLAGATPEAYAATDAGAREVEDLLGRIAHGIAA